jgi:hypothetical protein
MDSWYPMVDLVHVIITAMIAIMAVAVPLVLMMGRMVTKILPKWSDVCEWLWLDLTNTVNLYCEQLTWVWKRLNKGR